MEFVKIDFMSQMKEFLESPPFLGPGDSLHLDYLEIDPRSKTNAYAVAISGMGRPQIATDVIGNSWITESANLLILMRMQNNNNKLREDIGDFIINYIRWIHHEDLMRSIKPNPKLPKFSNCGKESIDASGGMFMGVTEKSNAAMFQVQVHLNFTNEYIRED